jgi:hypothetical protein
MSNRFAQMTDIASVKAALEAAADEGSARLQDVLSQTPIDIRRPIVLGEPTWWRETKLRASLVDKTTNG